MRFDDFYLVGGTPTASRKQNGWTKYLTPLQSAVSVLQHQSQRPNVNLALLGTKCRELAQWENSAQKKEIPSLYMTVKKSRPWLAPETILLILITHNYPELSWEQKASIYNERGRSLQINAPIRTGCALTGKYKRLSISSSLQSNSESVDHIPHHQTRSRSSSPYTLNESHLYLNGSVDIFAMHPVLICCNGTYSHFISEPGGVSQTSVPDMIYLSSLPYMD